jgi:putative copper resistance protein D
VLIAVLTFVIEATLKGQSGPISSAWLAPICSVVAQYSSAVVLGSLSLAFATLERSDPAWNRSMAVAAGAATVWTIAGALSGFSSFVGSIDPSSDSSRVEQAFIEYATVSASGVAWIVGTLIAAGATVLCFAGRSRAVNAVAWCAAVAGLVAMAEQAEPAGRTAHAAAVATQSLSLVGLGLTLGVVVAMQLVVSVVAMDRRQLVVVRAITVVITGLVMLGAAFALHAGVRLPSASDWGSSYAIVVIERCILFLALVALVVRVRRSPTSSRLRSLTVVGSVVLGLGVALGRITAPSDGVALGLRAGARPSEILTGQPLPGPPNAATWATSWSLEPVWAVGSLLLAVGVAVALVARARDRRRRSVVAGRGSTWQAAALVIAVVVEIWATNGAPSLYGQFLVSVLALRTVLLLLVVPLLISWASPLTLVRAVAPDRADTSIGLAAFARALGSSRAARLVRHPVSASVLLMALIWAFFATDLMRWALENWIVGALTSAVALVVGCLAMPSLIRSRDRLGAPLRASARVTRVICGVLVGASFAAVGVLYRGPFGLVQASWFGATGRTWGATPEADQADAGMILIVIGAAVAVGVSVAQGAGRRARTPKLEMRAGTATS